MTESGSSQFPNGNKPFSVTVFITIFSLFLFVSVLVGTAITATNFVQVRASAEAVAAATFETTIDRIAEKQEALFNVLILLADVYSDSPIVRRADGETMKEVLVPIFRILDRNPHVLEVYAGYENGDYYQVFSFTPEDQNILDGLEAPVGTKYAIHEITLGSDGQRRESWTFLDNQQIELIRRNIEGPTYDPTIRPWYQTARNSPGAVIRTPPYVFAISPEVGMTFARAFYEPAGGGVFAADITMDRLSEFLQSIQPNENHKILIFDEQLNLLAHPVADQVIKRTGVGNELLLQPAQVTDIEDDVVQAVVAEFQKRGPFEFWSFELDGINYLSSVRAFSRQDNKDHIFYVAPRSEFEGRLADAARQGLIAGIIILALSIPVVIVLARMISKPLSSLSEEAARIEAFELDDPLEMTSAVSEVSALIRSMSNMKSTMRSMAKFVPKALVKDFLKSGRSVEVGGERRRISLMFTDVENFTPIADSMTPEELMQTMSEYFEEVVQLIIKQDGTVDKFVGDAIFAYWNAPLEVDDYEYLACLTAIQSRNLTKDLSRRWAEQGRKAWNTRYGVHAGETAVGNVGSSDRIDFTVIGDPVNIASRLEGLNKFYGTEILVSGPIVRACSDRIVFRFIDYCLPKGAGTPMEIYEPLGLISGPEDLLVKDEDRRRVSAWNLALQGYETREWVKALDDMEGFLKKYPDDVAVRIYIDRIVDYIIDPPGKGWDGITRFDKK